MKIGIISDIHSNLAALHKALDLLQLFEQVDTILCAGDLVDGEKQANSVVAVVEQLSIPCVQGNHDSGAYAQQAWLRRRYGPTDGHIQDELLASHTLDYLDALPLTLTFAFDGTRLLLAHGVPWDNWTYLHHDSTPQLFNRVVAEAKADIIILGHTHVPMCRKVESTWIVNPGSVGGNRDIDRQTCAVLTPSPFGVRVFDINSRQVFHTCGSADR